MQWYWKKTLVERVILLILGIVIGIWAVTSVAGWFSQPFEKTSDVLQGKR